MIRPAGPRGIIVVAVLALIALASSAFAAPKFPALTGRVVDEAHLLSADTQQKLTEELAGLEQQTGRQVVVATIPDLQGYAIEDYGYQLGRAWGIGDKVRNDGVVLLVAPNDRKVRIEVGYGLEPVLTDALSSTIVQSKILPAFRSGDIEGGIVAGTEAVVAQLALPDDQAKAIAARPTPVSQTASGEHFPSFIVILIVFWIILGLLRGLGGRRNSLWWLPLMILQNSRGSGGFSGGGGSFGGGGGGFSGGGGSFGGGGSSGGW